MEEYWCSALEKPYHGDVEVWNAKQALEKKTSNIGKQDMSKENKRKTRKATSESFPDASRRGTAFGGLRLSFLATANFVRDLQRLVKALPLPQEGGHCS